ncbi:hypothetical protein BU26DRAFT_352701 [Trematosphaeria pertusa]|uniref:Uncharacterized protein n=1 Tax=Trematosphaeria pertusa TaxID=390896 RepID=A0A6A6ICV6_9PLEO|nr:uncharacterized protein BU26DRAFT_352701 [Trematosphaeria pertusa]KAF2247732.1 hypothetical protein BU26DRAFT_352701 [Trematosphaeria pertusa]
MAMALTMTTTMHKAMDDLVERMGTMDIAAADVAVQPFRFFDLPYDVRYRIYELILIFRKTIDLDPTNARSVVPFLRLFLVNRRMHDEASRVFYSRNTFRVFPIHGRFHTKAPLLARLPTRYRAVIRKLELRLGPGWTKPPRSWIADGRLGLQEATKTHLLKIFVEFDPTSHPSFEGFGEGDNFYTQFSVALVRSLLAQLPSLADVEFDAYPSVSKRSSLLQGLIDEVKANNKRIVWGSERGWDKIVEVDLARVLQTIGLGAL